MAPMTRGGVWPGSARRTRRDGCRIARPTRSGRYSRSDGARVIWVPLAGGGRLNGYRYRDALRPLTDRELTESYNDGLVRVEALSQDPSAELGEWAGHGPALSVYVQWGVYAMRDRRIIDMDECKARLERLALIQRRDGLHPGYRGIHYGRSGGWEAPRWWGSDLHAQHQCELIQRWPADYSSGLFNGMSLRRDWRWVGA